MLFLDLNGFLQGAGGGGGLLMRETPSQTLYEHYNANGISYRIANAANANRTYRCDAFGKVHSAIRFLGNEMGKIPW